MNKEHRLLTTPYITINVIRSGYEGDAHFKNAPSTVKEFGSSDPVIKWQRNNSISSKLFFQSFGTTAIQLWRDNRYCFYSSRQWLASQRSPVASLRPTPASPSKIGLPTDRALFVQFRELARNSGRFSFSRTGVQFAVNPRRQNINRRTLCPPTNHFAQIHHEWLRSGWPLIFADIVNEDFPKNNSPVD